MDETAIQPGIAAERETTVTETLTARHMGSGGIDVLATPAMIALMEEAAVAAVDPLLREGQASVGISVTIRHLAATPRGERIRARAEVSAVDGRRIMFSVQAWDEHELIGEGEHTRYIIDVERLLQRLQDKLNSRPSP
jgi:predicted thioesterase